MQIKEVNRAKGKVYYAVVDLPTAPGEKRRQQRVSAPTKRELREKAEALRVDARNGRPTGSGGKNVGGVLDNWLAATARGLEHRTEASYRDIVTAYLKPRLGSVRLRDLAPMHIERAVQAWSVGERRDGRPGRLAPASVAYNLRVLRTALTWAVKMRLIPYNPAVAVDPPKAEAFEAGTLTVAEFTTLLSFSASWRGGAYRVPLLVAAAGGLRRGEVVAVKWNDVRLADAEICVRSSVEIRRDRGSDPQAPATRLKKPKAGTADTVAVPPLIVDALRSWKVAQAERLLALGVAQTGETFVFDDGVGNGRHPDAFGSAMRKLISLARVPRVRLHDMRHTFGTWLVEAGVHQTVVQKQMRHKSERSTKRYTHPSRTMQHNAATALDGLLSRAVGESDGGM